MNSQKINKICVIGLGYVGLPLAHAFAFKGYEVVGFDVDQSRIEELNNGCDRTLELDKSQLNQVKSILKYSSNI